MCRANNDSQTHLRISASSVPFVIHLSLFLVVLFFLKGTTLCVETMRFVIEQVKKSVSQRNAAWCSE